MENVMVCVTKQKTCERLISFGQRQLNGEEDQLFIIHVAESNLDFLGNSKENEALEYLYEKAREVGANLTVEKSCGVLDTLVGIVIKNKIDKIIVGQSGQSEEFDGMDNFNIQFKEKLNGRAELIIVPA